MAADVATVKSDRVNVRGQPSVYSETITQLRAGEKVKVLDTIRLKQTKSGDLAEWLKISLPTNTTVWVYAAYVDDATRTVAARRLNVRAGPGENFSVLGQMKQGDAVREIRVMDDWMEIEPPTGVYGFVAASYLAVAPEAEAVPAAGASGGGRQGGPRPAPPVPVPATGEKPEGVERAGPPAPVPAPVPSVTTTNAATQGARAAPLRNPNTVPPEVRGEATPAAAAPAPKTPLSPAPVPVPVEPPRTESADGKVQGDAMGGGVPEVGTAGEGPIEDEPFVTGRKRIIVREGIVVATFSIQAPTGYQLKATDTGKRLNYLLTMSREARMSRYRGQRVVVRGEEQLDPRWPNQPMIAVQEIDLAP
jgi:SH3-like domain-containing protein